MRRVQRIEIPGHVRRDLARRQRLCTGSGNARQRWETYRGTAASALIVDALRAMSGRRWRCYYCSDSRGSDVDHFVPISVDFSRTFDWLNHQWSCTDCNRRKSRRYEADHLGAPLMLDPTSD